MRSTGTALTKLKGFTEGYSFVALNSLRSAPSTSSRSKFPPNGGQPSGNALQAGAWTSSSPSTSTEPTKRTYSVMPAEEDVVSDLEVGDFVPARFTPKFFDFRVLQTGEEIERVIEKLGDDAIMSQLCAAVNRLKQLPGPPSKSLLELLAQGVFKRGDEMTAKHISSWWHACAKMRYFHDDLFAKLGELTGKEAYVSSCTPMDLSNALYGMGVLQKAKEMEHGVKVGNGPVADWFGKDLSLFPKQDKVIENLAENTIVSLHPARLNEVQICGTIYGFGLLRFQEIHLLEPLFEEAIKDLRLMRYVHIELVNILYGMSMMGYKSEGKLGLLLEEICKPARLSSFREPEMSAIIQALRNLDWKDEKTSGAIMEELGRPGRFESFSERGLSMMTTNLRLLGVTRLNHLVEGLTTPENMDAITPQGLAMALYNLCCSDTRNPNLVDQVVEKALESDMLASYSEKDISNLMFSLSVFRKQKPGLYDGLSSELMKPERLVKFGEHHLANIFYGGGKLNLKRALLHCYAECLKPHRLESFTVGHLYNIVYGLGQIDFEDHDSLDMLLNVLIKPEMLEEITSQQISTILYSLGRMGYKNQVNVAKIMEEATTNARLEDYSSQGLASIVYGLSFMDFRDGRILGALLKEVILPKRLADFRPQELGILVYGLGKIGVEDSRVIEPILEEILTAKRMLEFTPHNLTNILYGLAQLNRFDKRVWDLILKEVTTPGKLSEFKTLEISLVLYAVGMKMYSRPGVLNALLKESIKPERLENFSVNGLASVLYSLSQLEYIDEKGIRALTGEFVKSDRLEAASPHHIANVVFSIGVLKYKDKTTVRALKEAIMAPERLPKFSRQGLYNILFGLAMLKYRSESLLNGLWNEATKIERLIGFSEREWGTIAYSVAQLNFKDEEEALVVRDQILTSRGLPTGVRRRKGGDLTPQDIANIREEHRKKMLEEARLNPESRMEGDKFSPRMHDEDEPSVRPVSSRDGRGWEMEGKMSGRGQGFGRGEVDARQSQWRWREQVKRDLGDRDHGRGRGEEARQGLGPIQRETSDGYSSRRPSTSTSERKPWGSDSERGRTASSRDSERYDDRGRRGRDSYAPSTSPRSRSSSEVTRGGDREDYSRSGRGSWHEDRARRGSESPQRRWQKRPDFLETSDVGVYHREPSLKSSRERGSSAKSTKYRDGYPTQVDHSIPRRSEMYNQWRSKDEGGSESVDGGAVSNRNENVGEWRDESTLKRVPILPGRADSGVGYPNSLKNVSRQKKKQTDAKDKMAMENMADDLVNFVKGMKFD